jgi:hypothetical protein
MANILVYHRRSDSDCPDGACALWVANLGLPGQDNKFIGVQNQNDEVFLAPSFVLPFQLNKDDDVFLLDFCYPRKILAKILAGCKSLTILDHHYGRKDDIAVFSDRILGGIDPNECGASYSWKYFFPDKPLPWFMRHVRLRDTGAEGYFKKMQPDSEAIGLAMCERRKGKHGAKSFPVFDRLLLESKSTLIEEGRRLIGQRDQLVQKELECWDGTLIRLGQYDVPFLSIKNPECFQHCSEVGSRAARHYDSYPFVAIVMSNPTKISLRSRDIEEGGTNVRDVAKLMGGEGHPPAAGFAFPNRKALSKALIRK